MPGVFFSHSEHYGKGGLLTGKYYLLSTTWNAKADYFGSSSTILKDFTPDDILSPFHITQQYIGLRQLTSFSEHDVIHKPDPEGAVRRLKEHIKSYVLDG